MHQINLYKATLKSILTNEKKLSDFPKAGIFHFRPKECALRSSFELHVSINYPSIVPSYKAKLGKLIETFSIEILRRE